MTSWAERMHRRAATFSSVVTSCGHSTTVPFPRRLEKVKFGVPLDEVCKNDIPGPLLVLILKLNKEAPYKKDVFRAPGHQGNMKQLIHFLQAGRLVNMDNFSVYTIASVLKKFLRKLPGGIFGQDGEQSLFSIIDAESVEQRRDEIHRLVTALPAHTQRLLILLFGTFRMIASNAERASTGMTAEALGVSVAPSFFQSCVRGSKPVKMEDVHRFKVATRIMKFLIENFGVSNLFGRDNYEFYARITGRILKVEEDWIFSFRYPPENLVSRQLSLEAEKSWFKYECERWGLKFNLEAMSRQEESQSAPALNQAAFDPGATSSSLGTIPENNRASGAGDMTLDELRAINRYAESTRSLSFLPQVHERQAARMRTRSEWFLADQLRRQRSSSSGSLVTTASGESIRRASFRRRREHHRSSSRRKNKENGSKPVQQTPPKGSLQNQLKKQSSLDESVTEQDCTEIDVHTFHVTLTYKPRI